jgi:hypothetical protein
MFQTLSQMLVVKLCNLMRDNCTEYSNYLIGGLGDIGLQNSNLEHHLVYKL